jgi:hypothetical protein
MRCRGRRLQSDLFLHQPATAQHPDRSEEDRRALASPHGTHRCVDQIRLLKLRKSYLSVLPLGGFRSRTPGPPPFSSMNSTPAASSARRTDKSFAAVIDVSSSASSARRMVAIPTDDARARSCARQRRKVRAALICPLVRGRNFILTLLSIK